MRVCANACWLIFVIYHTVVVVVLSGPRKVHSAVATSPFSGYEDQLYLPLSRLVLKLIEGMCACVGVICKWV